MEVKAIKLTVIGVVVTGIMLLLPVLHVKIVSNALLYLFYRKCLSFFR